MKKQLGGIDMSTIEQFLATFWGRISLAAGGLFGIGIIAFLVNIYISHKRNVFLNKILKIEEKNNILLTNILESLKQDGNK